MRHYYAEFHPYGIRALSGGMRLYRFMTAEERDEWVSHMNRDDFNPQWQPVTVREISHRYDLKKFDIDQWHDTRHRHEGPERTSAGRTPEYVTTRPNYRF